MKLTYLKNVATLTLSSELCIGCGRCAEVCPHGVFVLEQFSFESDELLGTDLPANPCRDNSAGKRDWTGKRSCSAPKGRGHRPCGEAQDVPSQIGVGGLLPKELPHRFSTAKLSCDSTLSASTPCTVKRQSQSEKAWLGKKARITEKDLCMECGACALNCPVNALEVKAGVGCAAAIVMGWLTGSEPNCDCSGGDCC